MDICQISQLQIAKLVLGYLKIEKCLSAHKEFLNSSLHFKDFRSNKRSKCIATRINGLSLTDIILDYAEIYTIIQERLEETNYFNQKRPSQKLVTQLLYLLDNKISSRASTPSIISRCSTPIAHTSSQIKDFNPEDVNTTPLKSLPGNHNEENTSTPKRKLPAPTNRSHRLRSYEENKNEKDNSDDRDNTNTSTHLDTALHAFHQTLLEHEELQQKIAENINENVIEGDDIDSAIKAVLQKTESDPVFETLMGDIIGSVAPVQNNSGEKINLYPVDAKGSNSIEEHNNVAIDSILASQKCVAQPLPKTDVHEKLSVNTSGDIIVYEGTFDNYMKSGSLNTPTPQITQPIVTGSLLMVNQNPPISTYMSLQENLKSCILVNNTPVVGVPAPSQQPQYLYGNVLTEQEILAMPTVIVCDNKNQPPQDTKKKRGKIKTLLPKTSTKSETTQTLSDYITLYKCNDSVVDDIPPQTMEPPDQNAAEVPAFSTILHVNILENSKNESSVVENTNVLPKETILPVKPSASRTPNEKISTTRNITPRSGSKSHVRALDFKFQQTPGKDVIIKKPTATQKSAKSKKSPNKVTSRSVKSLFPNKKLSPRKKSDKGKSWDAALRVLTTQDPSVSSDLVPKKKRTKSTSKPRSDLNKTEEDAAKIEASLELAEKVSTKRVTRRTKLNTVKSAEKKVEAKVCAEENVIDDLIKAEEEEVMAQNKSIEDKITLINCRSTTPRYKKKCNTDGSIKKERRIREVSEAKAEVVAESSDKTIQSPSKLNANKRSIVEENVSCDDKIKTPDIQRVPMIASAAKAKRNIIPYLETPVKDVISKVPGFFSPINTNDTPFTKVFKQHMEGVDIASLPTPKFPLTPAFPFTPLIDGQSPASNRPTDYSTSSSYYQPSDSEQNRSLEVMIMEECKRPLEKKSPDAVTESANGCTSHEVELVVQNADANKVIADKMKSLASNVIGRKNLNLVHAAEGLHVSTSESSESDSSSDDSTSSNDSIVGNNTVIQKDTPPRYCLRSKHPPEDETTMDINKAQINTIINKTEYKPELVEDDKTEDLMDPQAKVLKELEEKRKRTIAKFKSEPPAETTKVTRPKKKPTPKAPPKKRNLRSNTIPEATPHISSDEERIQPLQIVETEMLSSKSATDKPQEFGITSFENVLKNMSCEDKSEALKGTTDDADAEHLVKGLKQWGIHLVHNKSPHKLKGQTKKDTRKSTQSKARRKVVVASKKTATRKRTSSTKNASETKNETEIEPPKCEPDAITPGSNKNEPAKTSEIQETEAILPKIDLPISNIAEQNQAEDSSMFTVFSSEISETVVRNDKNPPPTRVFDFKLPKQIISNIQIGDDLIDISLTVTPYYEVVDISAKGRRKKLNPVKILDCVTIPANKDRPLKVLYKQLVIEDTTTSLKTLSPLDDLYTIEKSSYDQKRKRSKSVEVKKVNDVKSNKNGDLKCNKSNVKSKSEKKITSIPPKSELVEKVPETTEEVTVVEEKIEPEITQIVENTESRENIEEKLASSVEASTSMDVPSELKRKAVEELEGADVKKVKEDDCKELLNYVGGVEIFLKQLHGE